MARTRKKACSQALAVPAPVVEVLSPVPPAEAQRQHAIVASHALQARSAARRIGAAPPGGGGFGADFALLSVLFSGGRR